MTAKTVGAPQGNPVLGLSANLGNTSLTPQPSRRSSGDSYSSPASSSDASLRASTPSSRRPSFSRHQSLAPSPKVGLHAVESILDLAQAPDSAHAALLNNALLHAVTTPKPRPSTRPVLPRARRSYTAPIVEKFNGAHAWYTDKANPVVDGLTLRQTVSGSARPHVSLMPGGVHLVHMVLPRPIDSLVAADIRVHGQSRYAAQLKPDLQSKRLLKVKYNGAEQVAKDGYYACIIDQNNTLLVSVIGASTVGAPAGAHANLAGGLPVRFAGELQIQDGRVVWLNNASGHYRTPALLIYQALTQPLLMDAVVDVIGL